MVGVWDRSGREACERGRRQPPLARGTVLACIRPIHVAERMHPVDLIGLVAITLLAVLFLRGSRRMTRVEGAILVLAYAAFITAAILF